MWPRGREPEGLRGTALIRFPGNLLPGLPQDLHRVSLGASPPEKPHQGPGGPQGPRPAIEVSGKAVPNGGEVHGG